jgi:alpha-tubulin suppressor-like RCC1 family protein
MFCNPTKLWVIYLITGSLHCVACSDQGEVYTWGDNDEGQLGDGTTNAIQRPRLVVALQVTDISNSYSFMLQLCTSFMVVIGNFWPELNHIHWPFILFQIHNTK